jgi:hypothetical protein
LIYWLLPFFCILVAFFCSPVRFTNRFWLYWYVSWRVSSFLSLASLIVNFQP